MQSDGSQSRLCHNDAGSEHRSIVVEGPGQGKGHDKGLGHDSWSTQNKSPVLPIVRVAIGQFTKNTLKFKST